MIIDKLKAYIEENEHVVIGIDGPSGSGKSSLASYLEKKYDVTLFHVDDYFLPAARKTTERLKEPGGNFDHERMQKEIFDHIKDFEITSNKFNCKTGDFETRNPVKRKSIVIIEGVYALYPRFSKYYNYTVFLNIDRGIQLERILERSNDYMLQRFIHEFIPLEDLYFKHFDIQEQVDLFVKNSQNIRF